MKKKIFFSIFAVAMITLFLTAGIVSAFIYKSSVEKIQEEVRDETVFLRDFMRGQKFTVKEAAEFLRTNNVGTNKRITIVDLEGRVQFDNFADESAMVNHSERPEIIEALEVGEGEDLRNSETLGSQTYYFAILVENDYILRISDTNQSFLGVMGTALETMIGLCIIVCGITIFMAFKLSDSITLPINQIDLEDPLSAVTYEELAPLLHGLESKNADIRHKIELIEKNNQELLQAEKMRREFSANVSHELKTPLTSIMGSAEIMENGLVRPEDIPEFAGRIRKESRRMLSLIEDIIKISRLDEGDLKRQFETVDLETVCTATVEQLREKAAMAQVEFSFEKEGYAEGETAYIQGIPAVLGEIVFNLCDNAIAYNREEGKVWVVLSKEAGHAVISVKDTGVGIPKDSCERVFERFYRVDKSHSKKTGGTGLGLSIVKHGAQLHDAKIELTSEEGIGTTVRLLFG